MFLIRMLPLVLAQSPPDTFGSFLPQTAAHDSRSEESVLQLSRRPEETKWPALRIWTGSMFKMIKYNRAYPRIITWSTVVPGSTITGLPSINTSTILLEARTDVITAIKKRQLSMLCLKTALKLKACHELTNHTDYQESPHDGFKCLLCMIPVRQHVMA